jgi:branched-chain amino acid transport system permease protein
MIIGLVMGATYAIAATGLVLTFTTSRVFNLAHGAIGMAQVFVYYQFRVAWHIPEIPSLLLTLFVVAPIMGIVLSQLVMQRLARTTIAVRLMGTLAIFVLLQGIVLLIWGNAFRALPGLISDNTFRVFAVQISYNQLATVIIAIAVAIALRVFLRGTRTGTAMRAVVDNSELAELTAISPARIQNLAWAIGSSLAGLSAILIAPSASLDIGILSLLVVSAFAAAIIGGLANIGWTYVGGLGLGVAASLMTAYFPYNNQFLQGLPPSLPFIVLFIALVVMRRERQALQKVRGLVADIPASPRSIVTWALIFVAVMAALAPGMSSFASFVVASGLVYGAILLSMVLLTGLAGQVSLCQFSFVGIGAITMIHLSHHMPYAVAALIATVFTGVVGALIALPALRLRGLYVALITFAFALMCDNLVFSSSTLLGSAGQAIPAPAPTIFGLTMKPGVSYVIAGAVLAAIFAIAIQFARRGKFGRALTALRDSPEAAAALGLNLARTKLTVFGISAAMAGLAGCLYAGLESQVGGTQFSYLISLTALLILAIQGVGAVPGAILGGAFYAFFYLVLPQWITSTAVVNAIQPIAIGLAVLGLLKNPEGAWPIQVRQVKALWGRRTRQARPPNASGGARPLTAVGGGH